ncbi:MAG TPA: FkbM family methyltransferase [Stellaceae bacterium]|jgi:FkbM family methyltransferase|nr:FkbM family methyltransferase [Stellaceae bacterium]
MSEAWALLNRKAVLIRQIFDSFLTNCQPDIICDVGCFNADEIVRFRKLSPRSACFGFEADGRNVEQFIKPRNDLGDIVIEHMAVSDRTGETRFNMLEANDTAADWRRAAGSMLERSDALPARAVTVRCATLDDYFRPDIVDGKTLILSIVVEGTLFNVIEGAKETLGRTIALCVELERHQFWKDQKLAADNVAALKAAGFVLVADSFTEDTHPQSHALFVNEKWLALSTAVRAVATFQDRREMFDEPPPFKSDTLHPRERNDFLTRSVFDSFVANCQPDIICDVGSYNAAEIVRFRRLSPKSACFGFEANGRNVEQFIEPRKDLGDIVIEHMAVSNCTGETTFNMLEAEDTDGDWRRAAGSLLERSEAIPARVVTVRCTTLDDYFRSEIAAGKTFILWIDVEGALFNVIEGAKATLGRTIALRAELERHQFWKDQKLAADNVAALNKAGFVLLADTFIEGTPAQSDALFINKNWLALSTKG